MIDTCLALGKRLFAERQFLLRSGDKVRYVLLPGWMQAGALVTFIAVLGGIGGLAGAYHNLHKAIHRKEAEISFASNRAEALASLRQSVDQADSQYAAMAQQFEEARLQLETANADNDTLRASIEAAEARVAVLDKTRLALEQRLNSADKALAGKSGNLAQLSKQLADSRTELRDAEQARAGLQKKLAQLQADSQVAHSRTTDLKDSLAMREQDMQRLAVERERLRTQLDQQGSLANLSRPRGYVGELERLIASTGVDIDRMIGKLNTAPVGQGGPYVAFDARRVAEQDKQRQADLQNLVSVLPLAAPLAHFQLESPFGERIDPINHRTGFHSGVDLAAPYRTPVMATAPGVVTFTGVKDDYGRVVEITHAHGIVTRYAHLHRILVAPGQKVALHQTIAELGSSGRSTGPHVHYEVLVDGTQLDPAKFMEAGKSVVQINASR